jgi:hypothetical protein
MLEFYCLMEWFFITRPSDAEMLNGVIGFELGSRSEIGLPPPYEYVLQNPVIAAHN